MTVSAPHADLPDLPGDIRIWTGWPIFDIKIVQFEMNEWMRRAGFVCGYSDMVYPMVENWDEEFSQEVKRAEEGLLKILEWNCNQ